MRVLIAGGSSSLARAMIPVLSHFAEVITAGRIGCDVALDLADSTREINLPHGIDVVVNTAAAFGEDGFDAMIHVENVNALGVLRLCKSCIKAKVERFVSISSIFAQLDAGSSFYGAYALSKRHSDELANLYCARFALPLTIVRPSQFYGLRESHRKHHPFLSIIIDKAARGEDILIYGKNDALRNFIHVEDVAEVVARTVQRGIVGTYACMNPQNLRYSEIVSAAIAAFGSKSTFKFAAEQPDIPDNIFAPDDTLFRLVDYYPKISIAQGMRKEAARRKSLA